MAEHLTVNQGVVGSSPTLSVTPYRKKVLFILKITKTEAFAMRKLLGEKNVKKSYSKHPTYFLIESRHNINCLNRYQREHTVC